VFEGAQDVTGLKTFKGDGGSDNVIFQGGSVVIKQWGSPGEISPQLRVTGEFYITGDDGEAVQIERNSPWLTGDGTIFYTTGNVGIGTDSPEYKLDIGGSARLDNLQSTGAIIGGAFTPQQIEASGVTLPPFCGVGGVDSASYTGATYINPNSGVG
jgi:hypothetical protein